VPVGTYTLATNNPTGSSGSFASTPVINSGSFAANTTNYITTGGGQVNLNVLNLYSVSYNANGLAGTAPTDSNAYTNGATVTVQSPGGLVIPPGYSFAGWNTATDGSGTTYSGTFAMPANNVALYAIVAVNSYTLTYNAGANGTISGTTPQTVVYGGSGSAVTAVPNTGYHFTGWNDGVATAARTDIAGIGGTNVTAGFAINTYTITASAGANGSITPGGVTTVNYGGSQIYTITPDGGYNVADVQVDGGSVGPVTSYTFSSVATNHTINATFVTACTAPAIIGGIDPTNVTATVGDQVVLTLTNVTGTAPFAYQWLSNTVAIAGATYGSYTNLSVSVADAGNYQIIVTNDCGAVTSSVAVLAVNPQTPVIASAPTATTSITYGQPVSDAGLTGGSVTNAVGTAVAGIFAYTSPTATPNSGTTSQAVTFTPTDTNNYNTVSTTVSVTVNQATSTATVAVNNSATYDGTGHAATVTLSGTNTIGSVTDLTGGQALQTNANTYAVTATFVPVDTNYTTLTGLSAGNFTINQATPIITWSNPAAINYGAALGGTQLNADSGGVSGSFVYTPASGTVLGAGNTQTLSVQFTPSDTNNYSTPSAQTVSINVDPASLTITANSVSKSYGQTVTFAGTEFTSAGLTNGDTVTGVILVSAGATNTAAVGSYPIVASAATGTGLGNYTITYTNGTLTVLAGTNALLANLAIAPGALSQTFSSGLKTYTATNAYPANGVTVTATSVDTNATLALSFNGTPVGALTNSLPSVTNTMSLSQPANTLAVTVVSQDLSQTNTYTVNVLLQPSQSVPKLTNSVSGSTLTLTWSADHLGYRLLVQTNDLNNGVSGNINDWGTVPGTQSITTTNFTIITAGVTNEYYRLVYP
jgi:hypothetical protein